MSRVEEYKREAQRLATIKITPGQYFLKSEPSIKYDILQVDEDNNTALIKTIKSGFERQRTLYWCKKRLEPVKR